MKAHWIERLNEIERIQTLMRKALNELGAKVEDHIQAPEKDTSDVKGWESILQGVAEACLSSPESENEIQISQIEIEKRGDDFAVGFRYDDENYELAGLCTTATKAIDIARKYAQTSKKGIYIDLWSKEE